MVPSKLAIRFLASVRSLAEAQLAAAYGADIIDCKEPRAGALGALDVATIAAIRQAVPSHIPVSATVGDDAVQGPDLLSRVTLAGNAGADFVKIGLESSARCKGAIDALSKDCFGSCRLVGVVLADKGVDLGLVELCAPAGFAGVLLDTADKSGGALPDIVHQDRLAAFVARAHENGLFAGLAGALRAGHVSQLSALKPDVLGFRGALCRASGRENDLDPSQVARLRALINKHHATKAAVDKSLEVDTV